MALHSIPFGLDSQEISRRFEEAGVSYKVHVKDGVAYAESGNANGPILFFIHGSPGSWDNFIAFMTDQKLVEKYRIISVSRPGYGSTIPHSPTPFLEKQASVLSKVIPDNQKATLVGHSMGAPIAVRLAMDHPEKVKRLILLSGALDPKLEEVKWYQKMAEWSLITWMLPDILVVCNRELIPLRGELLKMMPLWETLKIPVTAIHGLEDQLVPIENMKFLEKNVSGRQLNIIRLPDANHFIPWTHVEDILKVL